MAIEELIFHTDIEAAAFDACMEVVQDLQRKPNETVVHPVIVARIMRATIRAMAKHHEIETIGMTIMEGANRHVLRELLIASKVVAPDSIDATVAKIERTRTRKGAKP